MHNELASIVKTLIQSSGHAPGLAGLNIFEQFDPEASNGPSAARSLNAAFLIVLAGNETPYYDRARQYIAAMHGNEELGRTAVFIENGLDMIGKEVAEATSTDPDLAKSLLEVHEAVNNGTTSGEEAQALIWKVLFPEGSCCLQDRGRAIADLQNKRKIEIKNLNPDPVSDPVQQILFTSNALLTVPHESLDIDSLDMAPEFKDRLKEAVNSNQMYWYDHPIPLGIENDRNEVIYGLRGLSSALEYESARNEELTDKRLSCLLSVSVTHGGLQALAREYLDKAVKEAGDIHGLDVFVFTEAETDRLKKEVLFPSVKRYYPGAETDALNDIFGVDGEYGRHYSFLKAVTAWWQVMIDSGIKGTFKIDLDQVFPQKELFDETGNSAFEHMTSPLWGAVGKDSGGEKVELGLLAGALVNQKDIHKGLFTPDVPWPENSPEYDQTVFFSGLPQALSTEAEMMTRYDNEELDGKKACLQRIHVTGGTNGILTDSLRRHRPFTPTFIGRAEDQAYILSVLLDQAPRLRYAHKDGLIMRHDKAALIPEAIESAKLGKIIGDYIRILWFSHYARILPWPLIKIKEAVDPFTGCFVSELPLCVVYLRMALKAAGLFAQKQDETDAQAMELMKLGSGRLGSVIDYLYSSNALAERYLREKQGWHLYYDVLDRLEEALRDDDSFAHEMKEKSLQLMNDCRIQT